MASEIVHLFGVLGTRLVIQAGCCGALADEIETGDIVVATKAFCGEGAAQYYNPDAKIVESSSSLRRCECLTSIDSIAIHQEPLYTTAALFAEGERELERWFKAGWAAVDMETATTFAVAEHFGMERLSVLFTFDNPRKNEHILMADDEKQHRRQTGNQRMIDLAFDVIRESIRASS